MKSETQKFIESYWGEMKGKTPEGELTMLKNFTLGALAEMLESYQSQELKKLGKEVNELIETYPFNTEKLIASQGVQDKSDYPQITKLLKP